MNETELDRLLSIFNRESTYGYSITISEFRPVGVVLGACYIAEKHIILYAPDNYQQALLTILHEVAHSRNPNDQHSQSWVRSYVQLMERYGVNKKYVKDHIKMGPTLDAWVNS